MRAKNQNPDSKRTTQMTSRLGSVPTARRGNASEREKLSEIWDRTRWRVPESSGLVEIQRRSNLLEGLPDLNCLQVNESSASQLASDRNVEQITKSTARLHFFPTGDLRREFSIEATFFPLKFFRNLKKNDNFLSPPSNPYSRYPQGWPSHSSQDHP